MPISIEMKLIIKRKKKIQLKIGLFRGAKEVTWLYECIDTHFNSNDKRMNRIAAVVVVVNVVENRIVVKVVFFVYQNSVRSKIL